MSFYFHYYSNAIKFRMYLLELLDRYRMTSPNDQPNLTILDKWLPNAGNVLQSLQEKQGF